MDPVIVIGIGAVVVLSSATMGLATWWRTTRRAFTDAWRGADSDLDVVDAGFDIVLRSKLAPHLQLAAVQQGKGDHRWVATVDGLRFGAATTLRLALTGYARAVRAAVIGTDIQTGDAAFDDRFDIEGSDADVVRAVFVHDDVRAATRALFEGFEVEHFAVGAQGTLRVEVRRYGLDVERTRALHTALHHLVSLIEQHTPTTTPQLTSGGGERVPSSVNAANGVPVGIRPW